MSNNANEAEGAELQEPATDDVTTPEATPPAEPADSATAFAAAVDALGGAAPQAAATISVAAASALAQVAAQAAALGVSVDLADAFAKGTSAEDLRASVLASLAARSTTTAVNAQHQVRTQVESPIVAAAKKAAAASRT